MGIGARRSWRIAGGELPLDHTLIMGILNVTPDSFSDGGRFVEPTAAVGAALGMADAGADVIDVGGESTRPGADAIDAREEASRVLPVIEALAGELAGTGVALSVDTSKAEVAARALDAGAHIVNDVTALGDPDMAGVVAAYGAGLVVMHMRGDPRTMQDHPVYDDVVGEVRDFLEAAARRAVAAGVAPSSVVIDPGIGFGKTAQHNWALLAATDVFAATGHPVLIGASRKRFLGELTGHRDPSDRDLATAAVTAATIVRGAAVVRVHNVRLIREVAQVADAMVAAERMSRE